jgi:hypothetical protein
MGSTLGMDKQCLSCLPGFNKLAGALGEYNGKFMINQMILRGASVGTAKGHSRKTYRNFFTHICVGNLTDCD